MNPHQTPTNPHQAAQAGAALRQLEQAQADCTDALAIAQGIKALAACMGSAGSAFNNGAAAGMGWLVETQAAALTLRLDSLSAALRAAQALDSGAGAVAGSAAKARSEANKLYTPCDAFAGMADLLLYGVRVLPGQAAAAADLVADALLSGLARIHLEVGAWQTILRIQMAAGEGA